MAHLKLIAPIVIALFAIVLEAVTARNINDISRQFWKDVREDLSLEDQANATKAYSFVEEYFGKLEESEARTAGGLLDALKQVLLYPDQCNDLSLKYVATITIYGPQNSKWTKGLTEATKKYASECLTKDYITNKIKSLLLLAPPSRAGACFLTNCFKRKSNGPEFTDEGGFIDKDFIADYWSEHQENWPIYEITGLKATKAVAKAINRKNNIKDLKTEHQVHAYLKKRLYKPCFEYEPRLRAFMDDIWRVGLILGDFTVKIVSSLEKSEQNVFFRYYLCVDIKSRISTEESTIDAEVLSALKSLPVIQ